jgi:hypothetical protein
MEEPFRDIILNFKNENQKREFYNLLNHIDRLGEMIDKSLEQVERIQKRLPYVCQQIKYCEAKRQRLMAVFQQQIEKLTSHSSLLDGIKRLKSRK